MFDLLKTLLSDKKGGTIFTCFGIWHLIYLFVIFGLIALIFFLTKNKNQNAKNKLINGCITFAFFLYIADFFLMPFAYGGIDIEKLPFHVCTTTCVLCFLSRRNYFLDKFKYQFALLGFISNLVYVIYPAGVGWHQVHPASYRVIQTLLFHGIMTAYGFFTFAFEDAPLKWKTWYKELIVTSGMAIWALIGNLLYNGFNGDYSFRLNWFLFIRDPFYLLPLSISPYVMPFVVITLFFAVQMSFYAIYFTVKRKSIK